MGVRLRIPVTQMGATLTKHLNSSTACMLLRFHLFNLVPSGFTSLSSIMAALFRKLSTTKKIAQLSELIVICLLFASKSLQPSLGLTNPFLWVKCSPFLTFQFYF